MATTPEAYVHLSTDRNTLTFYYDTLRADRKGIKCGIRNRKDYRDPSPLEWSDDDYDWRGAPHIYARTAVFDASFIRQKTKCGLRVGRMSKINNELDNQDGENELR